MSGCELQHNNRGDHESFTVSERFLPGGLFFTFTANVRVFTFSFVIFLLFQSA